MALKIDYSVIKQYDPEHRLLINTMAGH